MRGEKVAMNFQLAADLAEGLSLSETEALIVRFKIQ